MGHDRQQHDVIIPGPWLLAVNQVEEKTGRNDEMLSVLVLAHDRLTTFLRIVISRVGSSIGLDTQTGYDFPWMAK